MCFTSAALLLYSELFFKLLIFTGSVDILVKAFSRDVVADELLENTFTINSIRLHSIVSPSAGCLLLNIPQHLKNRGGTLTDLYNKDL